MKKIEKVVTLIFLVVSLISAHAIAGNMVEISQKDYQQITQRLGNEIKTDIDLVEFNRESHQMKVLVSDSGQNLLDELQIKWKMLKTQQEMRDNRDIDPQYFDYDEVTAALANIQTTYPNIAQRFELGTTAENRKIWALKISDNALVQEDEPEILILGLHEAREIMSTEIAMDMAQYLTQNYGSDPDVTNWVNTWQIWIVPMLNPDGSAYCWSTDQYWIKNRHDLGGDVFGVDLGHNYPVDWGECFGSSSDPNSNGYRGESPGSEPEIQAIFSLVQNHKFMLVISYHSFNEMVLYPYGCTGEIAPENDVLSSFANSVGNEIRKENGTYGYETGNWWELLYSNDGNETDYFYANQGSMAIAIQLNAESYYPSYSVRDTTVTRNRPGWKAALDIYETGKVVEGTITDACTNEPVQATYYYDEYPLTSKESPRQNNPDTGFYSAVGKSGTLTLVVEAGGYLTQHVPVHFETGVVTKNVSMVPVNEPGLALWAVIIEDQTGDDDGQLDPGETAYLNVQVCL